MKSNSQTDKGQIFEASQIDDLEQQLYNLPRFGKTIKAVMDESNAEERKFNFQSGRVQGPSKTLNFNSKASKSEKSQCIIA